MGEDWLKTAHFCWMVGLTKGVEPVTKGEEFVKILSFFFALEGQVLLVPNFELHKHFSRVFTRSSY